MNLFDAHHSYLMEGKKIRASHWHKDCFLEEKIIETFFNGFMGENECIVDQDGRPVTYFFKDYPFEWRMYEWEVVE